MPKRNVTIDAWRGFAIILVVLGHGIQFTYPDADSCLLYTIIYAFHMPLFMFISGYTSYRSTRPNDFTWLKKRAGVLVIPFCFWIFERLLTQYNMDFVAFGGYLMTVLRNPDSAYWFLWVLFLNCCVLSLGQYFINKFSIQKFDWAFYFALIILIHIINPFFGALGIALLTWYVFFYLGGYLIAEYKPRFARFRHPAFAAVMVASALFFLPQWRRVDDPLYEVFVRTHISSGPVAAVICLLLRYFVPVAAIYSSYVLIKLLPALPIKGLAFLGRYTIEIYVLSNFFLFHTDYANPYIVAVKVVFALFMSIVCALVIEKGLLGRLLFGKSKSSAN